MNTPINGKHRHFTDLPIRCCLMSSALTRMQAFSIFNQKTSVVSQHESHLEAVSLQQKQQLFLGPAPELEYRLFMNQTAGFFFL